jgi:Protein of unknown function (DUF2911)
MKSILTVLLCALSLALSAQIQLPAPSPTSTITQAIGLTKITIEYSRPSVKGRKIFGDLVPFDKVWRTGANKITNITFADDVMVNGQKVPAGTYGWYTIPGKQNWIIAINSDAKQWGAYEYDQKKDVLRLTVQPQMLKKVQEHLSIAFDNFTPTATDVVLSWEKSTVRFRVEHDPHERIMANIKEKTSGANVKSDDYYAAAEYYRDKNIDLPQALTWANKVLETDKAWWSHYLRASIYVKMGKCAEAATDAKVSIEGAKKDGDSAYIKLNEKILKQCGG